MNEDLFEKIKKFIYESGFGYNLPFPFLFKRKTITSEMELEKDLRITGDDADEFLIDFSKEFNVDVSQFSVGEYFEGEKPFYGLLWGKEKKAVKILTIGHLVKAAMAGRLDEEVINS